MSRLQPTRHAPGEVDEYLEAQEPEFRHTLEQLRDIVRRVTPAFEQFEFAVRESARRIEG